MVRIICRIKPPKEDNIEVVSDKKIYLYKKSKDLLNKSIIKPYQFELDQVYDYNIKTDEIYKKEIVNQLEKNFGIFIYGHTGSGKTFTMFGNNENNGIFDLVSEHFNYSYDLEAIDIRYNGNFDLFTEKKIILYSDGKDDNCYNSVKQTITKGNFNDFKNRIFESRTRGISKHNKTSSRSHLVLYLYKNNKKYTIVDLAGNERKPSMFDKANENETIFINSSLLALKECFRSYGKAHMPYRRSDLTRLLKDIIINKNLIICTIHSGFPFFYDSVDTLNYIYSLLNKVRSKPGFYSRKVIPMSPKILPKLNKEYVNNFFSKNEIISDRKLPSPKQLFSSKLDLIRNEDNLSPKNINYKKFMDDDDLLEPIRQDEIIDDDDIDDSKYDDDYEEYDDYEASPKIEGRKKSNSKDAIDEDINPDFNQVVEKVDSAFDDIYSKLKIILKSKLGLDNKKKLIGLINNLLYKKIVSNYKILLDDNVSEEDCDLMVINTAATLEICIQELLKIH